MVDLGATVHGVPVQKPRRLLWLKNAVLAVSTPEQLLVPLMVNVGATVLGVHAVKMRNLLK